MATTVLQTQLHGMPLRRLHAPAGPSGEETGRGAELDAYTAASGSRAELIASEGWQDKQITLQPT